MMTSSPAVSENVKSSSTLKFLCILLVLLYVVAVYVERNLDLSPEAQLYQREYPDALRSGLSLWYFLSSLAWGIGSVAGVLGALAVIFSWWRGVSALVFSAPLIALAAYLQAPQSNYPGVEPTQNVLLWCACSSVWTAVVILASVRHGHHLTQGDDGAG